MKDFLYQTKNIFDTCTSRQWNNISCG